MPYSFTQIEKEKTRIKEVAFVFLTGFYFLSCWIILVIVRYFIFFSAKWWWAAEKQELLQRLELSVRQLSFLEIILLIVGAVLIALIHWSISTKHLVPRIIKALRCKTIDRANENHVAFSNILEELGLATGG
ncbi:MAG: hypothetical protein KC713_09355, partial [Candidatus Omnitrophica bacterium]|nr:hypothetical protein [Candidatus Omnitrophota bacterium]